MLFDWNRWLVKKEVDYCAKYYFLPSVNKWPGEITDVVRQIYDPHYICLEDLSLRKHRAQFDAPKNFVADPIGNAPLFDSRQEVYFSGSVYHDAIEGALFELGLSFCLWNEYVLVLSEAKEIWRENFINHIRVVYLDWLVKQFEIPKDNSRRLPKQPQLNSLFYDFIDGQQRVELHDEWRQNHHRPAADFQNSVLEVRWPDGVDKCHQEHWESGYAFGLYRNGPFIDMFSRPVLRLKRKN
jgi:hypothetical protein